MLYQLPNGGTITINDELYFRMSDEEFDRYIMFMRGSEVNNPFYDSALENDHTLMYDQETLEAMKGDLPDNDVDPRDFLPDDE